MLPQKSKSNCSRLSYVAAWLVTMLSGIRSPLPAGEMKFEIQEIETGLGVGYAVRILDLNADGRLDIAVVDTERVVWYQNPSWERHTLIEGQTKPDNVCFAPYDIDRDGQIDFALGADWRPFDTRSGGTVQWLRRGKSAADRWSVFPIGEEPTVHRMQWVDLDGDQQSELVMVPLMGRNTTKPHFSETPVRILAYKVPPKPESDPWPVEVVNDTLHVCHNFTPTDLDHDGRVDLLVASFEGVTLLRRGTDGSWTPTHLGAGNQETSPNRGASEIKQGQLRGEIDYIATIEPWHGFQVVVYTPPLGQKPAVSAIGQKQALWHRTVLDDQLQWGHAVWCADLDGDPDQELIIGVRDDLMKDGQTIKSGLRIYDPQLASSGQVAWTSQRFDSGGVAIEDLAASDLDGDGRIDIVAVGRKTKNARIYWNKGSQQ